MFHLKLLTRFPGTQATCTHMLHQYACLDACGVDMNFKMPYFFGVGVFGKWLGMMGMAAVAAWFGSGCNLETDNFINGQDRNQNSTVVVLGDIC